MPYLQRDNMRPLTFGFAEEYRKNEELTDIEYKAMRIRDDLDGETFRRALEEIGLGTGKALGELLGVSERQANNYLRNPQKLNTAEKSRGHISKIESRFEIECEGLRYEIRDLEDIDKRLGEDDYADAIKESEERLSEVERAQSAIFTNVKYGQALRWEYTARMLIEGYAALDEERRTRLLDYMRMMLADMGTARANMIAGSMKRTRNGRVLVRDSDLAELVKGRETLGLVEHTKTCRDGYNGIYELPYEVTEGETGEPVYFGGGIDALVLDEYVNNTDK